MKLHEKKKEMAHRMHGGGKHKHAVHGLHVGTKHGMKHHMHGEKAEMHGSRPHETRGKGEDAYGSDKKGSFKESK